MTSPEFAPDLHIVPNPENPESEDKKQQQKPLEKPAVETPDDFLEKGLVSNQAIAEKLVKKDLNFTGKREPLSGGFMGPIHLLGAEDSSGKPVHIVEKTFSSTRDTSAARHRIYDDGIYKWERPADIQEASTDVRPRLGEVDLETGELKRVVIDYIYNEERALSDLEGIPGIPESFGAVYEDRKGSILTQLVDGFDLGEIEWGEQVVDEDQINSIYDGFLETYKAAAEKGYVFNHPGGATIMVEQGSMQPFLIDWYNHAGGSIEEEGPLKEKFEKGLQEIEDRRASALSHYQNRINDSRQNVLDQYKSA